MLHYDVETCEVSHDIGNDSISGPYKVTQSYGRTNLPKSKTDTIQVPQGLEYNRLKKKL